MKRTTTIAGREVPIQAGELITVCFTGGGGGPEEAGGWEFWVVFMGTEGRVARCRRGDDPGERFRRMEGQSGYETAWELASMADGLQPAKETEVIAWLNDKSHGDDAPHAVSGEVGGRGFRVVRTADGYGFSR